jgi:hypothetical protein
LRLDAPHLELRYAPAVMSQKTSVQRNRITIDERTYEARALGGGRFDVLSRNGARLGGFVIKQGVLEAEDLGLPGADPVEQIGLLWAGANLSAPVEAKRAPTPIAPPLPAAAAPSPSPSAPSQEAGRAPAPVIARAPVPAAASNAPPAPERGATGSIPPAAEVGVPVKSVCRIATHLRPDPQAFQKAKAYQAWLRTQPGVQAAYLTHDGTTGKTVSVSIWEDREKLAALRYAQPPANAVPLKAVSVELLWVVG